MHLSDYAEFMPARELIEPTMLIFHIRTLSGNFTEKTEIRLTLRQGQTLRNRICATVENNDILFDKINVGRFKTCPHQTVN